jgi:hypothetical protein
MRATGDYHGACRKLGDSVTVVPSELAATLANHMDEVIEQQDTAIEMIATGGPERCSRDEAVRDTFAWQIAFTETGKKYAVEHGWTNGSVLDFVNWIGTHYPIPLRRDPISAWRVRSLNLRREKNPHQALKKYRDFMIQTADGRAALEEAHAQVDQYIEEQIDRMRGR